MEDGTLDLAQLWVPTPKNEIIRSSFAPNRLRVGGTGSSKSSDALMEAFEYMVRYDGLSVLFIRRQLKDLKLSSMLDWREFIPEQLYREDRQDGIVTLYNGSRLFWGHLPNNSEKDLSAYLSAAFPIIIMDECGQFSRDAWQFMSSRNRVNRECKPDEYGNYPVPFMSGATNPIGPHWGWLNTEFVKKKPFDPPEGAKRDKNGVYWLPKGNEWELVYNPADWEYVHSTLLDNPYQLKRDPELLNKLKALKPSLRDKLLYGYLDSTVGQYFDCWNEDVNVIELAKDPDAIIWQPWQPRWVGWDWGRAHWTSVYWFTIALVKKLNGEYAEKVVCYREYVDRGKNYEQLCTTVAAMTKMGLPALSPQDTTAREAWTLKAIYFSHEKFTKQFDQPHAPVVEVSRRLTQQGLPPVSRNNAAAGSRVGKATLLYDYLSTGKLVVLSTCQKIIDAIPQLVTDQKNTEDVEKIDGQPDDCYDGFSMALYNWFGQAPKPQEVKDRERLDAIEDPLQKRLEQFRLTKLRESRNTEPQRKPEWM